MNSMSIIHCDHRKSTEFKFKLGWHMASNDECMQDKSNSDRTSLLSHDAVPCRAPEENRHTVSLLSAEI